MEGERNNKTQGIETLTLSWRKSPRNRAIEGSQKESFEERNKQTKREMGRYLFGGDADFGLILSITVCIESYMRQVASAVRRATSPCWWKMIRRDENRFRMELSMPYRLCKRVWHRGPAQLIPTMDRLQSPVWPESSGMDFFFALSFWLFKIYFFQKYISK